MPFHLISQVFYNRDFWLHTLLLPCTIFQRLFMTTTCEVRSGSTYMPSERSPHLRTLMAWPDDTYNGVMSDLLLARQEVALIANTIAMYEPVWMYARPANVPVAESYFTSPNVTVIPVDVDQLWIRDTGPVFVNSVDSRRQQGIDFNFNFWGFNFIIPNSVDRTVALRVLQHSDIERKHAGLVTEGGAIEVDGQGTLIATESSILNPDRNPGRTRAEIEDQLCSLLGVRKIIWLHGVQGIDVTDYQINKLARFGADSNTVILSRPNALVHRTDPRYVTYEQAKFVLSTSTNALNQPFRIVEIEEAATVPRAEEDGLAFGEAATSYVNFYLANGVVIVPQFGEERTDWKAREMLRMLFPDRTVELVSLNWMPWAGGGVHCATQQWPVLPER